MEIRPVRNEDAFVLADLLNEIIAGGGTTALEKPFTPEALADDMLTGSSVICCFVALDDDGSLGASNHLCDPVAYRMTSATSPPSAASGGSEKGWAPNSSR
jgi:hypothetical protein